MHTEPIAAEVLLLIRDGNAATISSLERALFARQMATGESLSHVRGRIRAILSQLEGAGLITSAKGRLAVTALVEKVQDALQISLTSLSRGARGAITVNPVFGAGKARESVGDVFVLMPFAEVLRPVYEDHIVNAAASEDLTVCRADDFFAAESVISDIWRGIYNSLLVVADCTGRNPNVFYEIGIAHTVGRPTILISQSLDDVPFDLRHRRCIVYTYTPRGMREFETTLASAINVEKRLGRGETLG